MDKSQVCTEYVISTASRRWGVSPKRTGNEWHSACPQCGGRDRFIIFPNGGFFCRVCGCKGWLDDDSKNFKPDPTLLAKWQEDTAARDAERQKEIAERLTQLQTQAERNAYLLGRDDERRHIAKHYFNGEGISDWAIKHYQLGYVPDLTVKVGDLVYYLPAYTIPIKDPKTQDVINMQYRLADPPAGIGKYRQATGLPAASFYADDRTTGDVIVCEGAKKAIVIYEFTEANIQLVGLPGCMPGQKLIDQLKEFDRVWVWLDPGAERAAQRIADQLDHARIIRTSQKPDDAIRLGNLTVDELRRLCDEARRTK